MRRKSGEGGGAAGRIWGEGGGERGAGFHGDVGTASEILISNERITAEGD